MTDAPRANWWPWFPVVGLIAVTIPSGAMVVAANRVQPTAVSSQPYLDSLRHDDINAERRAFLVAGLRLETRDLGGRRIEFTLVAPSGAPSASSAELLLYRPSDQTLDRRWPWSDPARPLTIELPRHGRWRVTVNLPGSDGIVRSTVTDLDVGS